LKATRERKSRHKLEIENWNITSLTKIERDLVREPNNIQSIFWHLFD